MTNVFFTVSGNGIAIVNIDNIKQPIQICDFLFESVSKSNTSYKCTLSSISDEHNKNRRLTTRYQYTNSMGYYSWKGCEKLLKYNKSTKLSISIGASCHIPTAPINSQARRITPMFQTIKKAALYYTEN